MLPAARGDPLKLRLATTFAFLSRPTRKDIERRDSRKMGQVVEFSCACRVSRRGNVDLCPFHEGMEVGYDAAIRERF